MYFVRGGLAGEIPAIPYAFFLLEWLGAGYRRICTREFAQLPFVFLEGSTTQCRGPPFAPMNVFFQELKLDDGRTGGGTREGIVFAWWSLGLLHVERHASRGQIPRPTSLPSAEAG